MNKFKFNCTVSFYDDETKTLRQDFNNHFKKKNRTVEVTEEHQCSINGTISEIIDMEEHSSSLAGIVESIIDSEGLTQECFSVTTMEGDVLFTEEHTNFNSWLNN